MNVKTNNQTWQTQLIWPWCHRLPFSLTQNIKWIFFFYTLLIYGFLLKRDLIAFIPNFHTRNTQFMTVLVQPINCNVIQHSFFLNAFFSFFLSLSLPLAWKCFCCRQQDKNDHFLKKKYDFYFSKFPSSPFSFYIHIVVKARRFKTTMLLHLSFCISFSPAFLFRWPFVLCSSTQMRIGYIFFFSLFLALSVIRKCCRK